MSKFKNFLVEGTKPRLLNELFINLMDISKLTQPERDRQLIRLAISAEMDATNLYESMAKMTNNQKLKTVLLDIALEEKIHFGEFDAVLEELDDEHEEAKEEGREEMEDLT